MEYYEVAAKWWADQLRNVKSNHIIIGDDSDADMLFMLQGTLEALEDNTPSENIDAFERLLSERIRKEVEVKKGIVLMMYCGPDLILKEIAEKTGCSTARLPGNARMQIWEDEVFVRVGYAAKAVTIFPINSDKE